MDFEVNEWGSTEAVGRAYGFKYKGRFHGVLETKAGAYRGNHIHPVRQYTLLLSGRAKYLLFDGKRREFELVPGEVFVVNAGVPHILIPEEDAFTFEWWDGDFIYEDIIGIFEDITRDLVGPKDHRS